MKKSREEILKSTLQGKPVGDIDIKKVAQATPEYSGADITAIVDIATEEKIAGIHGGRQYSTHRHKRPGESCQTTQAYKRQNGFATARNYALYANESGLYDDILKYMKIKK